MGMAVGGSKGTMSEPNIVPLIDVLLVLIIIFMVITPTISHGLDACSPAGAAESERKSGDVEEDDRRQVTAGGDVLINQDKTSWDQLGPRLEDIFRSVPKKSLSSRATTTSNSQRSLAP